MGATQKLSMVFSICVLSLKRNVGCQGKILEEWWAKRRYGGWYMINTRLSRTYKI